MSARRAVDPKVVVLSVLLGLACGWLAFNGLSGLAQPGDLKPRMRRIEAAIVKAENAPRESGDAAAYVQNAICRDAPSRAADLLRARLGAQASAAGLPAPKVVVTDPPGDVSQTLTPVMFQLEATGRYDNVLTYLKLLARDGPEIFADTLDLRSQVSAVSLKMSGRVMCSTSAA